MASLSVQCSAFQYRISFNKLGVTASFTTTAVILPSGLTGIIYTCTYTFTNTCTKDENNHRI